MIFIENDADFDRLAEFQLSSAIEAVMLDRRGQLDPDLTFAEQAKFVVVPPGEQPETVAKLKRWLAGETPDSPPRWEWVIDHGHFYETVVVISDDGYGVVILIDKAGIDPELEVWLRSSLA